MTNESKLTVLVLGVGNDVSQGILKALALSKLPCRVLGACISPLAAGLYTVDRAFIAPRAESDEFIPWLSRLSREEHVQAILSGVEPILDRLSSERDRIEIESGALCMVSDRNAWRIGNDKLLTCQWLQERGFHVAQFAAAGDEKAVRSLVRSCGFPLVAKPRKGGGARGLKQISGESDLEAVRGRSDYLVQEHLGSTDEEYTAGCFVDDRGDVRGTIVLRRELSEGTTHRAVAGLFPDVRDEAQRIAQALKPRGPCNLQLRRSKGRAVCFEINVRFSGTTGVRALLGFNEVDAALRNYVLKEPATDMPRVAEGIVLRYWNEMVVSQEAHQALERDGRLDQPARYPLDINRYGMRS